MCSYLEGLRKALALAKVMDDPLKLADAELFAPLDPGVELGDDAGGGVSERADLVVQTGLVGSVRVVRPARIPDQRFGEEEFRIHWSRV